jgi:hypothetical protein
MFVRARRWNVAMLVLLCALLLTSRIAERYV